MRPIEYYSRKDIQEQLLAIASQREAQPWFGEIRGKRPDVVNLLGDIREFIKQGMTSFHISEERWHDPLQLKSGMLKKDLDTLRQGWDCILDLDCKYLPYSLICGEFILEALKFHDIKNYSLKFSGNHGLHIGIPFEAFPDIVNSVAIKDYFPDGIRVIAEYLKDMIREHLTQRLLQEGNIAALAKSIGKTDKDLLTNGQFDPYTIVDVDSVLISSRHLFRAPYSINEKSGMVSLPLRKIQDLDLYMAKPENVQVAVHFLDRKNATKNEAKQLLVSAFDWAQKTTKKDIPKPDDAKTQRTYFVPMTAVSEEYFPECIKKLMTGVKTDGRKRSIFILVNFLKNMGWTPQSIETFLLEWNKKNYEPLREGYLRSQLHWFKNQPKITLPPNCDHPSYYKTMGIYCGDTCARFKNPVNCALKKAQQAEQQNKVPPKKEVKKKDEKKTSV